MGRVATRLFPLKSDHPSPRPLDPDGVDRKFAREFLPGLDVAIRPPRYPNLKDRDVPTAGAPLMLVRLRTMINEARLLATKRASETTKEIVNAYLIIIAHKASECILAVATDRVLSVWVMDFIRIIVLGIVNIAASGCSAEKMEIGISRVTLFFLEHMQKYTPI